MGDVLRSNIEKSELFVCTLNSSLVEGMRDHHSHSSRQWLFVLDSAYFSAFQLAMQDEKA